MEFFPRLRLGRRFPAHCGPGDRLRRAFECRQVEPDQCPHRPQGIGAHLQYARPHQELIFFPGEHNLTLVDMPGYGYAAVPKAKVEAWTSLIHDYLRGRANLARVYVLIDARHGLKDTDSEVFDTLGAAAVSHQMVLTKADQVTPKELEGRVAEIKAALAKRAAAFPEVLATSAHTGAGIPELRAAIVRLQAERS